MTMNQEMKKARAILRTLEITLLRSTSLATHFGYYRGYLLDAIRELRQGIDYNERLYGEHLRARDILRDRENNNA